MRDALLGAGALLVGVVLEHGLSAWRERRAEQRRAHEKALRELGDKLDRVVARVERNETRTAELAGEVTGMRPRGGGRS